MGLNSSPIGQNMSIKEATSDLHEELEAQPFNIKMFEGNQTNEERAVYLMSNIEIFSVLDPFVDKPFQRLPFLENDLSQVHSSCYWAEPSEIAIAYATYLKNVCSDVRAHIYLNYMGFMYGGQIMKKKYPNCSSAYSFENIVTKRQIIRDRYCESHDAPLYRPYINEVKLGFRWHIAISKDHLKMTTNKP